MIINLKSAKMIKEKVLTLVWIFLIILTILEYTLSEVPMSPQIVVTGIILASFFKFFIVAFEFLELKHAHGVWKYLTISLVTIFLVLILGIYYN